MPDSDTPAFVHSSQAAQAVFASHAAGAPAINADAARKTVGDALRNKDLNHPAVFASLATLSGDITQKVQTYGTLAHVPAAATPNMRNDGPVRRVETNQ